MERAGLGSRRRTSSQILREYSRYFIGDRYTDSFAQGLLALERNWRGPLAGERVGLHHARAVPGDGARGAPRDLLNWRFQQALYRAYYDAYVRSRLLHETAIEERALERLRDGAKPASRAQALADAATHPGRGAGEAVAAEWRLRVYTLAEALFQSIRQQLSVARYRAIAVGRGATLDSLETPLNNGGWLRARFAEAAALDEGRGAARGDRPHRVVDRSRPGRLLRRPRQPGAAAAPGARPAVREDPQRLKSTMTGFGYRRRLAAVVDDPRGVVLGHAAADAVHRTSIRRRSTASASSTRATCSA